MNKSQQQTINYQKILDKIIDEIKITTIKTSHKPTLLLHACCGPCSSYVIEYLASVFDITIYYYNPNIHPSEEYFRRLDELKKFLTQFPESVKNNVKLVIDDYQPKDWFDTTGVLIDTYLQDEEEKGERCRRCYKMRMKKAFIYACQNNFDWFTTTLSISPYKDSQMINVIGNNLQNGNDEDKEIIKNLSHITKFLPSDFKKRSGFLRSTQLSAEYGLWRQEYCGCVYSMRTAVKEDI